VRTKAAKEEADRRVATGKRVQSLEEHAVEAADNAKTAAEDLAALQEQHPESEGRDATATAAIQSATEKVASTKEEAAAADKAHGEAVEQHGFTDEGHQENIAAAEQMEGDHEQALKAQQEAEDRSSDQTDLPEEEDAAAPGPSRMSRAAQSARDAVAGIGTAAQGAAGAVGTAAQGAAGAVGTVAQGAIGAARGVAEAVTVETDKYAGLTDAQRRTAMAQDLKKRHHEATLDGIRSLASGTADYQEQRHNMCQKFLQKKSEELGRQLSEDEVEYWARVCMSTVGRAQRWEGYQRRLKRDEGPDGGPAKAHFPAPSAPSQPGGGQMPVAQARLVGDDSDEEHSGTAFANAGAAMAQDSVPQQFIRSGAGGSEPKDAQGGGSRRRKRPGRKLSRKRKGKRKGKRSGRRRSAKKQGASPSGLNKRRTMKRKGVIALRPRRRKCTPFTESDCTF